MAVVQGSHQEGMLVCSKVVALLGSGHAVHGPEMMHSPRLLSAPQMLYVHCSLGALARPDNECDDDFLETFLAGATRTWQECLVLPSGCGLLVKRWLVVRDNSRVVEACRGVCTVRGVLLTVGRASHGTMQPMIRSHCR